MNNKIFLFLFLILLIPILSAVPPTQQNINTATGIQVEFTEIDIIKNSQFHLFNAHVFNVSDGLRLDNSTVTCDFQLFDDVGHHLVDDIEMTFHAGGDGFQFNATGGNFTRNGEYEYLIHCNASAIGGFASVGFEVNGVGIELTQGRAIIFIGLFGILIFVFVTIIFGIQQLPLRNETDEEGRILSISYLKYLRSPLWFLEWMLFVAILFLTSNVALGYLETGLFGEFLFTLYKIAFGFTPLIVIVWIIWIFVQMFHDRQFQALLNKGIFPEGRRF